MKLLLLNPINRSYVIMPSLGLGYLAAVATRSGHEVSILNCIKERMTYDEFGAYIRNVHFDLIGFQTYSYDLRSVQQHLKIIRRYSPGTVAVAGGPHPSGDPSGTLSLLDDLDFAFHGEAETGLPLFLETLFRGDKLFSSIPGLVWRRNGRITVNPAAAVQDLDTIPMPAWDLLQPETYPEAPHGAFTRNFPTAPIIATRGCPSKCTFCSGRSITGARIRRRSLSNIMSELRQLKRRGIREFHIEDENFTFSRQYVFDFCTRLQTEQLDMSWSLPSGIRLDTLNRDMLLAMEKAGCYSLAVGIEFGTDRLLQRTCKGISLEMIRSKMRSFSGTRIRVTGFFMFGIPGESLDEMEETVRLALSLPLHRAQFNNFIPLPGSKEWDWLASERALDKIDWSRFFVHDVAFTDHNISSQAIKRKQRSAILRFYLRPRILVGLIAEIRSFRHLWYLIKRLFDALR